MNIEVGNNDIIEYHTSHIIKNIRLKTIEDIKSISNTKIRTIKVRIKEIINSINLIMDIIIKEIVKLLNNIGMRNNLLGFYCYVDGILYTLTKDRLLERDYMSRIYEKGKIKYKRNICAIEREMRYAKDSSWKYNSNLYIEKVLGYSFNYKRDVPTNMELILILTECIRITIDY